MKLYRSTFCLAVLAAGAAFAQESAAKVEGAWRLSVQTPHGPMGGTLTFKQEGNKLSGTCDVEHMASSPLTGALEGKKIAFTIEMQGGMKITFSGAVDGDSMSGTTDPMGGNWSAARATSAQKSVSGTVKDFDRLAMKLATDEGATVTVKFGPDTEVVAVAPGEHDLTRAKAAAVTDIVAGDRVLATYVAGLAEARRVVLITNRDIARRNEAERQDWKARGISGIVSETEGDRIALEVRTPEGAQHLTVVAGPKTKVRRYAQGTVRFADALPSSAAEISKGDQLQARGTRTGDTIAADDVVFGTFVTKVATITAIDREKREVRIEEAGTKKALTVKLTAASQLKVMPEMQAMGKPAASAQNSEHGREPGGRFDLQQMLEKLPAGKLEELKIGGGVIVTSTKGAGDELTAIMLLANADMFVRMANAPGGMTTLGQLHGGMLAGPGGISLPTMIQ